MSERDKPGGGERNSLSRRLKRYADVTTAMGGAAAKMAGKRMLGLERNPRAEAIDLKAAFGNLKGPLMKVAQMLASVPEALPADFAAELSTLQTQAPPMGWPFVRRRMSAELGPDWEKKFKTFEHEAAAAASLGQVHRAWDKRGRALACKLQYPDMASAVEADLAQLKLIFAALPPHGPRHRSLRNGRGNRRPPARRTRLPPRSRAHAPLSRDAQRHPVDPRARCRRRPVDRPPADDELGDRPPHSRIHKPPARRPQPHRDVAVQRLVASLQPLRRHPRRPASRQLCGPRKSRISTFSTTAASAPSSRNSSAA